MAGAERRRVRVPAWVVWWRVTHTAGLVYLLARGRWALVVVYVVASFVLAHVLITVDRRWRPGERTPEGREDER